MNTLQEQTRRIRQMHPGYPCICCSTAPLDRKGWWTFRQHTVKELANCALIVEKDEAKSAAAQ